MRILYMIKSAFQISGKRVDYSTEIIVTTGKPFGKQESWIQTLTIHQNKLLSILEIKTLKYKTTEVLKENTDFFLILSK